MGSGLTLDCNAASMCVTPHTDQEEAAHDESTQALALPSSTRVWDFLLGQKKSRYKRATDAASEQLTIWQKCTSVGQDQNTRYRDTRPAPNTRALQAQLSRYSEAC